MASFRVGPIPSNAFNPPIAPEGILVFEGSHRSTSDRSAMAEDSLAHATTLAARQHQICARPGPRSWCRRRLRANIRPSSGGFASAKCPSILAHPVCIEKCRRRASEPGSGPRLGLPRGDLSAYRPRLTAAGPAGPDAARRLAAHLRVSLSLLNCSRAKGTCPAERAGLRPHTRC